MGQKRYNQKDGVGKSKYVISYHDGKKKHKDGSDFFDIQIFRNKKDLAKFVNTLHKGGYKYGFNESVNEFDSKSMKAYGNAVKKAYGSIKASREAMGIAGFTGTRGSAVQKFIDDYNLNARKLFNFVKKGKLKDRMNFVTAIAGKPNNKFHKMIVKRFAESINEELSQAEIDKLKKIEKELKNASDIHKAQSDALAKGSKTHAAQADRISKMYEKLHKKLDLAMYQDKSGVPQGYNPMVEAKNKESKVIEVMYKYSKTEKKFYDKMAEHERRIGQRDYAKFIIMALKGFGINPRQYKRIPDAEEKLYQTVSKK